ncbi:hypothetical protein Sjap_012061 [Stephania japonica]|uniref:Uncharacterized protein n=1 Tax=Stephania japonica TaxID=461633 RepID=A0AAP0P648_9MAGN
MESLKESCRSYVFLVDFASRRGPVDVGRGPNCMNNLLVMCQVTIISRPIYLVVRWPAGAMAVRKQCSHKRRLGFSGKCAALVKEQRARIYILRRCATMLLCWYIQGDHD